MKKIYLLSLFAAVLAFAACSLEKRHYRKGYYLSWNHNRPDADQQISAPENTAPASGLAEEQIIQPASANELRSFTELSNQPSKEEVKTIADLLPALSQRATEDSAHLNKHHFTVKTNATTSAAQPKDDDDLMLLILLAIFLPPLAVYLHEGTWNGRCWLNLVLTLLCGFPGIIHALIVVLAG